MVVHTEHTEKCDFSQPLQENVVNTHDVRPRDHASRLQLGTSDVF